MNKKKLIGASALLATGLLAGGMFSVTTAANAADTNSTSSSASTAATPPSFGGDQGNRTPEAAVSADVLAKLTSAVEAELPGATVIRGEVDSDGAAYEAHVKKADGSFATVKFDANYKVTGVEADHGPKGGPMGGPAGGPMGDPFSATSVRPDESLATGATADKLTAAAKAEVADATVIRAEVDADGSAYEVHMKKADGSVVTVKFDSDLKVTGVEDGFGKGGPASGPRGGHGDDSNFQLPNSTSGTGSTNSGSNG